MPWNPAPLFEALDQGVAVYEPDGTLVCANPVTERMLGCPRERLLGARIWDLLPETIGTPFHQAFERVRETGQPASFEDHHAAQDRWYRNQVHLIDGRIYVVASDISDVKLAEEAARAAGRRTDEILAVLGHELRNPLAPILTTLQVLALRGVPGIDRELGVIDRQARHLVRLVDDLLDFSRITRGAIELRRVPTDLAVVVARAVETASPLLEQRSQHLSIDVPRATLVVEGDESRLAQVLHNLLTNAAQYTRLNGRITVRAAVRGDQAVLEVEDDGEGMPPDFLHTIFEPFIQGESGIDRAQGGLGVGLAIVRSVVSLHGGTVTAHSDGPGMGSRIVVSLPRMSAAPAVDVGPAASSHDSGTHRRVLLVDDNQDAADSLAELLRLAGHDVHVAYDGPGALGVVEAFQPEIALLDIGLPVMDGYELAGRLRIAVPALLRIVALTGYGQDHDRGRSHAAGFAEHVVKPVDGARLLALLDE